MIAHSSGSRSPVPNACAVQVLSPLSIARYILAIDGSFQPEIDTPSVSKTSYFACLTASSFKGCSLNFNV